MREDDEARIGRQVEGAYRGSATPSPGARERLLERIGRMPPPRRSRVAWIWERPEASLRVALAAAFAVVAGGALIVRTLGPTMGTPGGAKTSAVGSSESPMVRFELTAPGAAGVTLVGDFNGWDREATPMQRARTPNSWTVSLPLTRGRHTYGFVVDGVRWVADPAAPLAPADGFGGANSVVVVDGPGAS